jgi:hypothetical protein
MGLIVRNKFLIGVILVAGYLAYSISTLPNRKHLSEVDWECTKAGTIGIETQCLEYRRILK